MLKKSHLLALVSAVALHFVSAGAAHAAGERDLEDSLLHVQVSLSGVRSYSRALKRWQALPPSKARVRVINLWSKVCVPCLSELPMLTSLAAQVKAQSGGAADFLFIADPPDQTSAEDVVQLWSSPYVDALAAHCPGVQMLNPNTRKQSCMLKQVPDSDPAYREPGSDSLFVSTFLVDIRPITLLVDQTGTIRQAFVGSLVGRDEILRKSIERLVAVTAHPTSQTHRTTSASLR